MSQQDSIQHGCGWEYLTVQTPLANMSHYLEEKGFDGWELVSTELLHERKDSEWKMLNGPYYILFFKRPR